MTTTICVATDFSARADRAIDRALLIGEQTGAKVRVVHALDYIEADNADWAKLDRKMRECIGDATCETEFAYPEGALAHAISKDCKDQCADMLLVGPARYNSIGDYFLGTAVDYVLRKIESPVIVVKQRARSPYRHLIAGTDFSANSRYAILEAAKRFPNAQLHVAHGWRVPFQGFQRDTYVREEIEEDARSAMEAFMADLAKANPALANATSNVAKGNAYEVMAREFDAYCDIGGEGLVVVGSHGESGFRQAALGSQTSDMLRYLQNDVMVVNTKAAES
ncbi:universal stress protein [Erythrobacter sp. YT30]|uniref:universal stress protein n=1 Tax=Erythrobacter sp. YT30 TaxID=1735012 RepID=UPI00076C3700|nr:universal stress protein [Erythrobacter sp. YT30]KWV91647.1 hypothetical protein AUC45_10555 [Erythrobacter sp. YT30]